MVEFSDTQSLRSQDFAFGWLPRGSRKPRGGLIPAQEQAVPSLPSGHVGAIARSGDQPIPAMHFRGGVLPVRLAPAAAFAARHRHGLCPRSDQSNAGRHSAGVDALFRRLLLRSEAFEQSARGPEWANPHE